MLKLLCLVPFLPLTGFLILTCSEGRLPRAYVPWIGAGSVGLSAALATSLAFELLTLEPEARVFRQTLWHWMAAGDFGVDFAFYLDALSLNMLLVVTGIGFLIHVYSAGYMADDPGMARFFAYMNLFVFAMLILVLADNLPLLYLGWEGVGLCSYLLIGFWYEKPENGYAARKAFVVTRVGDTAMALGLFLLFSQLGTLDIQEAMSRAGAQWPAGSTLATAAALLLLGGAVGKSAQLPLQVWLPDAMAGPTPISALIHAATMVTAGVYLIARTHALFTLAPEVQTLVAVIGAITLLISGFSALTQTDIKRVLAYSTISQIGYMFLALGVGAWSAAIFHLTTHAFFKALLFLGAGAVILSLHHEQDIFRMGGLRRSLPLVFWTFLAGLAALVGLPFTSGYYSKHEILLTAYGAGSAGSWLWAAGTAGAVLTGLYSTRLLLIAFFGPERTPAHRHYGSNIAAPLVVLAILSLAGGLAKLPLFPALPETGTDQAGDSPGLLTTAAPFLGVAIGYLVYRTGTASAEALLKLPGSEALRRLWFSGWGMDWLYDRLFVLPFVVLARLNEADAIDQPYRGIVALTRLGHRLLVPTQTGQLRRYAAGMLFGAVLILAVGVWA
ncbi:NADH dehydrogenase I, L subunit [Methylococcus capsulatus str. Bath]|uniref:NADH dehydrogenase I, L subunit n=1 Tax=Methylococcus capsulatus (strain ATCC 33009 / NCIMB 11132 / Bath) TaxID=243233 RepID=Q608Y7_METCA|nr:NADH-quinone oxidoreductase subunit L [Methylococcus capsulatus]AAU92585.1 NADH dehydrogenase I, L subunit [Methylococcus capsulatus str. Bath]